MQSSRPSFGPSSNFYPRIDREDDEHGNLTPGIASSAFDAVAQQAFSNSTGSSLLGLDEGSSSKRAASDDEAQSRDRRDLRPMMAGRLPNVLQRRFVKSEAALSRAGSESFSGAKTDTSTLRRARTAEARRSSNVDGIEQLKLLSRSSRALSDMYDRRSRIPSPPLNQFLQNNHGVVKLDSRVMQPNVDVKSLLKDITATPHLKELHLDLNDVPHEVILDFLEQLKPVILQHAELSEFNIRIKDRASNLTGELKPLPASVLASLEGSPVTALSLGKVDDADAALGHLSNMPKLKQLQLGDDIRPSSQAWKQFVERQIEHVASGDGLCKLDASGLQLSSRGFDALPALSTLESLSIKHGSLGESGAQRLAALEGLRELTLNQVDHIDANSASALARNAAIQTLQILECDIDTDIADRFSAMPRLTGLGLDGNPGVCVSSIFDHDVPSPGLIAGIFLREDLQHLSIRNTGFTDHTVAALRKACPTLNVHHEIVGARVDPFIAM